MTDNSTGLHEIVVVDDTAANLVLLSDLLTGAGYIVRTANSAELAIRSIKAKKPSLILLDVRMSLMDGYEACRILKTDGLTKDIPVIFISALDDEPSKVQGFQAGGVDFISKPFRKEEVLARVKTHIELCQLQRKLEDQNARLLNEIAERSRNEEALLESEERFRMLFEKAPLGYQSLDENGCFIEVNETWLETLGYSKDEVIGKWFGDFLTPKYTEGFRERFPIFKSLGKIHSEFEMVKKNGDIVFIAFEGRIGYTPTGKFKQTHCVLDDITERRRNLIALAKSEERFRNAITNAPFPIMIHAEDGKVELVNDEWLASTGYAFEEISTTAKWAENAYGLRKEMVREDIEKLYSITGKVDEGEYVISTKSGEKRSWYFSSTPVGETDDGRRIVMSMALDFTERRKAEEKLKESEEKFRNLFENSTVGKSMTGIDGSLHVNKAFCEIVGYSEEELKNLKWTDITHPDDIQPTNEIVKSLLEGKFQQAKFEKRYIQKKGNIVFTEGSTFLQRDKEGKPQFFITSINDITERKKAEEALRKSEAFIRTAVENLPVIFYSIDKDGIFRLSIGAGLKGLGLEPNQVVGMSAFDIYKDYPGIVDSVRKSLNGEPSYFESTVYGASYDNYLVPTVDKDGILSGLVGVAMDISVRKKAEQALRENEELLVTFITHSPIYTYIKEVTPTASRVIIASDNFIEMVGISGSEMAGKTMEELFPPEFAEKITADDWDVVSGNEIKKIEEQLNDRYYSTIKFPISIGNKNFLSGYTIDITENKKAESKLRLFSEEMEKMVHLRTNELNETIDALEMQAKVFVGRELRMIELKEQIADLEKKLGGKS